MLRLMESGLTFEALQTPIDNPEMCRRLVQFWLSGGFEPTMSHKRAREIMRRNMFGVEDAIQHFGLLPKKHEIAVLSKIPFSEATLESCKESHVLVAALPFSILEIRGKVADREERLFCEQDWYNQQAFAKDKSEASWQLVRKTPVPDSMSKTWDE